MKGIGPDEGDTWVSITDLMTGLMATFLLIALTYMLQVDNPLQAHRLIEQNIFNSLKDEFKQEEQENIVSVDSSLTLRFLEGKVTMFQPGKVAMEPGFQAMLDSVLPKFLNLITRDTVLPHIAEIRIEGHASSTPSGAYTSRHWYNGGLPADTADRSAYLSYAFNLELSQSRAREVLAFVRLDPAYQHLRMKDRERLDFLFSATGMSFARRLDDNGDLAYITGNPEDKAKSLRVEFKIITSRPGGLTSAAIERSTP